MKHLLVILLALFGLVGCSNSSSDDSGLSPRLAAEYTKIHAYAIAIKKRIVQHLHVGKRDKGLVTRVNFKLDQRSKVTEVRILKSSGSPEFDAAVEQAVRDSFPYEALLHLNSQQFAHFRDLNLVVMPE